jgi:glycosyltransferase involved in cell wall biosynthesis
MVWALDLIRTVNPSQHLVYFSHNFETAVARDLARNFKGNPLRRIALNANSRRTANAELKLLNACQTVSTITEEDCTSYRDIATAPRYVVVTPGYDGPRAKPRQIGSRTPRQVLMLGSFDWLPKQLNLEKFVQVAGDKFQKNNISLNIVGSVPDKLRQRLSAVSESIHFLGYVDDLNAIYRDSRMALVFEETGGGFKLKLLDYIFNRIPVFGITSAVAGLPDKIMQQIFLAPDMQGLVSLIIKNIDQYEKLNASQQSAFEVAEQTFDWDLSVSKLVDALAAEART